VRGVQRPPRPTNPRQPSYRKAYTEGVDPEYDWCRDNDGDGIDCDTADHLAWGRAGAGPVSAGHTSTVNPTSHGENLVVRRSRQGQLLLLVVLSGNFAAYVVGWLTGSLTGWFAAVVIALATVGLLLSVIDLVRSGPRSTLLLRVGPAGVEVGNGATVPWSVLADVRLVRVRWDRQVVAFIPRPGVTVPSIPSPRLGSSLALSPDAVTRAVGRGRVARKCLSWQGNWAC